MFYLIDYECPRCKRQGVVFSGPLNYMKLRQVQAGLVPDRANDAPMSCLDCLHIVRFKVTRLREILGLARRVVDPELIDPE